MFDPLPDALNEPELEPAPEFAPDTEPEFELEPLLAPLDVDEPEPVQNKGKSNQKHATLRVWLFYGQPYGRSPYGRFSDSNAFPFLVIFLSFSDFRNFFLREILERENFLMRKN